MEQKLKCWCNSCREKVDVVNEIIETSKKGMPMLKANCKNCGRHLSVFLPKSYLSQSKPYQPPQPPTPTDEEKSWEFEEKKQEDFEAIDEENAIEKFKKDVEDNEILKKNGIETIDTKKEKPIKKTYYDLFKYFLVIIAVGILVFGYLAFQGYFQDTIDLVCGNSTCVCPKNSCACNCPECPEIDYNYNLSCGDCNFPDELNINVNVTGG